MQTDIEISKSAKIDKIVDVAKEVGINEDELELYGNYKAKISDKLLNRIKNNPDGKLVLVTAINPTPAGEGKTTVTIGLGQALNRIGEKCVIALREPSLGPVMGLKGGATGGGYSQVVPMDDINLHFTGDMHALTSANNLISAVIDNHIYQGNELNFDLEKITWKRAMDINDRALRNINVGLGGKSNGIPRSDGFNITVASEIMAVLCLANDIQDLRNRVGNIIVGYNCDGNPIKVKELKIEGAITALLKDAIKPNLIQTLENTPCIMHGGPFANIAHGCNSVIATKTALKLADIVVTEAGFGADLGAEKFLDIKCRMAGLSPSAIVIVATIRSLKYNGGMAVEDLKTPSLDYLKKGIVNLTKHIENMKLYGVPVLVTVNKFFSDTEEEIEYVRENCKKANVKFSVSEVFANGGEGGIELANELVDTLKNDEAHYAPIYDENDSIKEKIETICKKIYGASGVNYTENADNQIKELERLNLDKMPVCMAKTQYSLSDDPKKLGRPENFEVTVREIRISNGAGFIVVLTGKILTMPGLPKVPAAEKIDVLEDGSIDGIF